MTLFRAAVAAMFVVLLGLSAVQATDFDIQPVGPQDGDIWNNVGTDNLMGPWGLWGFVNGNYYSQAGIHTLPAIPAASVQSAELIIPANHGLWTTNGMNILTMNWIVEHFDAINDTTLTGGLSGTGDFQQPALGVLGLYAGPPWPGQDNARIVSLDVTAAVQADLSAGRASTAWRIVPTMPATPGFNDNAQLFFPTADMPVANGYPNNGARLLITLVPEPTGALLLIGGLALAMAGRRTRA